MATCNRYGTRGERQLGIDLLAAVKNTADHHVAQCKCYQNFQPDDIKGASDAFLKHIDHWRAKRVRRFVLIVSEPLERPRQQEQIATERGRFHRIGISYEVWSVHELVRRLKPYPDIVARYMGHAGGFWVDHICGPARFRLDAGPARGKRSKFAGPSTESQFADLISLVSAGFSARLDECRTLARKGLVSAAESKLADLQADAVAWDRIPASLQARTLRIRASLALDRRSGIPDAKALIAQADRLDGTASTRLRAQIVLTEQGPDACLEFLAANGDGSEEDKTLEAVCHLRAGRPQEAALCLAPVVVAAKTTDPERLMALALAAAGRSAEACEHARSAVAREPDGWATRMALGVVLYTASLSPAAVQGRIAGWPEPYDWSMVRRDDTSVARLREAADLFGSLHADKQERIDRETLQAFRLACLANDAERQAEAEAYCRDILRESATNAAAVAWALARAFPIKGKLRVFDPAATVRALEDLLEEGRGDLLHLAVLVTLLSWRGKTSKVRPTLRRYRRLFATGEEAESFSALEAEATIRAGDAVEDLGHINPDRVAMLRALREPDPGAARGPLIAVARRLLEAGRPDPASADATFRLAAIGFIGDVAPFADRLVESIGTADTIRLAAHAKASDGDDAGAVALLDERRAAFPGGLLPRDLRVLRAQCNVHLGRLAEAISEMQDLQESGAALNETLGLADMYVRRGDLALAAKTISAVVDDPGITPHQALRFAYLLGNEDPTIATLLWRRAVAQELNATLLPHALTIARRLALGPESAPVVERMTAHAVPVGGTTQQTPIVSMSIDQLREFLLARRDETQQFVQLHEKGTVPLHLLAPQAGWSLARLFHEAPLRRERTPSAPGLLLAAQGGRAVADSFPNDPRTWRLHLDVTAVLMAHHLGLLDAVERCFRPLRVSSHLVPTLIEMRSDLLDRDPVAAEAARGIIAAVAAGHVLILPGRGGAAVSELPETLVGHAAAFDAIALLWDAEARIAHAAGRDVTNPSGVVASLELLEELTPDEALQARKRLGVAGAEAPVGASLTRGVDLFCHANTIQELAAAGLLSAVCRAFRVHVEAGVLDYMREGLRDDDRRAATAAWLDELRERLSHGIQDGTYELLPIASVPEMELGPRDGPLACLLDMLRLPSIEGNVVWIDDRALNGYVACGAAPLLAVADVLAALRKYGRLSEEECLSRLLRLRAGGTAFIQAWDGELGFWLRRAPVLSGRLIETDELAVLRRYVAACLVRERILQIPPLPEGVPGPWGEVGFVISWQRALTATLTQLWADRTLAPECVLAYSRWLRDEIAVDRYERLPVQQPTAEARMGMLVNGLSTLLCGAFLLLRPFQDDDVRCDNYVAWLDTEVVGPRLAADPDIRQALGRALGTFLAERPGVEEGDSAKLRRLLTAKLIDRLPDALKRELMRDDDLLAKLGFDRDLRVIEVVGITLPAMQYLRAVAGALSGSNVEVREYRGSLVNVGATMLDGRVVATVEAQGSRVTISDPVNDLLADAEHARGALSESAHWLDVPDRERRAHLEALLAIPDPAERVMAAIDLRNDTAAGYYDGLKSHLAGGQGISMDHLDPPSAEALTRHLRLPSHGPFPGRLAAAAVELIAEFGIEEAFSRFGDLPTPLPLPILEAFAQMEPRERLATVARLGEAGPTPLQRVHLTRLAAGLAIGAEGDAAFRTQLAAVIAAFGDGDMATLVALVRTLGTRSVEWKRAREIDSAGRIAACWSHAGNLFRIIRPVVEPGELRSMVETHVGEAMADIFSGEVDYATDVACPRATSVQTLLVWGLAHALDGRADAQTVGAVRDALTDLLVQQVNSAPVPQGWLLEARSQRPNATASFFDAPIGGLVNAVTGTDIGKWYTPEAQEEILAHFLLAAGPDQPGLDAWGMVFCIVGLGAIREADTDAFREAVMRTIDVIPDVNPLVCYAMLRCACFQSARSPSAEMRAAVTNLFAALAPKLIDAERDPTRMGRCAERILRAAVDLARDGTGTIVMDEFVRLVRLVATERPVATEGVRTFLTRAARHLPFHMAEALWPPLLEFRTV